MGRRCLLYTSNTASNYLANAIGTSNVASGAYANAYGIFVMLISAALMCICGLLVKKCGWRWLQDFALPICMLASMALSIPLTFALV